MLELSLLKNNVGLMNDVLDKKIENVLDQADRMFIATSVGGNSSGASVFFSRDGEDLVFFVAFLENMNFNIQITKVLMRIKM